MQTRAPFERLYDAGRLTPSRSARLAAVRHHARPIIQDSVAARALLELVFTRQSLKKHRGETHVASGTSAIRGVANGRAAATSDHLVPTIKHGRDVGD